jgi:hypothetical protein
MDLDNYDEEDSKFNYSQYTLILLDIPIFTEELSRLKAKETKDANMDDD